MQAGLATAADAALAVPGEPASTSVVVIANVAAGVTAANFSLPNIVLFLS
jgi:hypothetical protein